MGRRCESGRSSGLHPQPFAPKALTNHLHHETRLIVFSELTKIVRPPDLKNVLCWPLSRVAISINFATQKINWLSAIYLRFSLWLIRYFLKTFVYTPSTPCRDVKFSQIIPLGDLLWNSLTEVMWHQINGFSYSKIWKTWEENVHVAMENDWSGSFVLLYGWNNEDVRWGFSLFKSIGKLWAI